MTKALLFVLLLTGCAHTHPRPQPVVLTVACLGSKTLPELVHNCPLGESPFTDEEFGIGTLTPHCEHRGLLDHPSQIPACVDWEVVDRDIDAAIKRAVVETDKKIEGHPFLENYLDIDPNIMIRKPTKRPCGGTDPNLQTTEGCNYGPGSSLGPQGPELTPIGPPPPLPKSWVAANKHSSEYFARWCRATDPKWHKFSSCGEVVTAIDAVIEHARIEGELDVLLMPAKRTR